MELWDVYQFLLFLGAFQGIVLGTILYRSDKRRKYSNRYLSFILFFFAYRLITEGLRSLDIIHNDSWTYHVFLDYDWVYGSLIFLYVRTFIIPDDKFRKSDFLYFIPVLLEFIISNYVKIQNFYWDGTTESLTWLGNRAYVIWMDTPFQIMITYGLILFFVYKSYSLLRHHTGNTILSNSQSSQWIRFLLPIYNILAIVVILLACIDYIFFDFAFNPFYKVPVYASLAIITYWLGLKGYAQRDEPNLIIEEDIPIAPSIDIQKTKEQLHHAMKKQQLYKNPTLTLSLLAEELDIKPYQLTQVLNRTMGTTFSDFVNQYRVNEAERLINSTEFEKYTLLSIAYESGFNSKASFNRAVKKLKGLSPKELRVQKGN